MPNFSASLTSSVSLHEAVCGASFWSLASKKSISRADLLVPAVAFADGVAGRVRTSHFYKQAIR
jgi:hypothetical protein